MARRIALTGNLDVGRIKINGIDFLTVEVDAKAPSKIIYTFMGPKGGEYEVLFADRMDDLGGRDPETCVILSPLAELDFADGPARFGQDIVFEQPRPLTGQSPCFWNSVERLEYY